MIDRPHVALIVETSVHYGREVLEGITRYVRSHQPWSFFLEERELWSSPPAWLKGWKGSGVICRKTTAPLAKMLTQAKIPIVDLSDIHESFGVPRIGSDHHMIGHMAADHLMERGFTQFAFCGFSDQSWSNQRREGFGARLRQRGFPCNIWESVQSERQSHSWEREQDQIGKWLRSLARPVGLMACNDIRGQHVLDACLRVNIAVPEEAAVIGVDDDAIVCNLCHPPLSSVVPNAERVGYEAAALLDSMMSGGKATEVPMQIAPLGITIRQSSDVLAIDDAIVAAAVRFIRERACQGCGMKDLLRQVPMSRSLLERRFRQHIGRSPQAEIRAVQLKRVKQLLTESDLPLDQIAPLAGYTHPEYMSVVFKRETGQTPGQFRSANNAAFANGPRGSD